LNAELEACLRDNEAVVPRLNPAYGKANAKATQPAIVDPLQGWKNRGCDAIVKDGILTARGNAAAPFLGVGAGLNGPAKVKFRLRVAAAGRGAVDLLAKVDSKSDEIQRFPFAAQGGDWQEVVVDLPRMKPSSILRLFLPSASEPVEIDWVELTPVGGKPRRWDF
jgi:hypothetical protein